MTDVELQMSREPYPFVNAGLMERMEGSTVAIVGKVDKIESSGFTMRTSDEKEISVINYKPGEDQSQHISTGNSVEVRGVVGPGKQLTYSDLNRFEGDFDMGTYEQMLEYYHGLCKHLCVPSQN